MVDAFVARGASTPRGELPLEQLSEFLLVAAILLEIKSRRLLPGPDEVEGDEELVGWEERDLLLARLLELRAYSAAADLFAWLFEAASQSGARVGGARRGLRGHAARPARRRDRRDARRRPTCAATEERPVDRVDLSHVTVDAVTVAETVATWRSSCLVGVRSRSAAWSRASGCRLEIIVHFLAVLELCKLGRVSLGQGSTFGDLQISWLGDEPDPESIISGTLEVDDYDG